MKLIKPLLAGLAAMVVASSFALSAHAMPITGFINFAGSVAFDTTSLATATRVNTWRDVFGNAGFSNVTAGSTGSFSGIAAGTQATMGTPYIFNPSTPTPALWSVGGFTFDLLSSTIVSQTATDLTIEGAGTVSGNGFTPTNMTWMFTTQNASGHNQATFSFSANSSSEGVPDSGTAISLLGIGLMGLGLAQRKLAKA
jgi:VPDSG-CTERM motif